MKMFLSAFIVFAVLFLFSSLIWADDITTLDGKTYHAATIVKTEPDGITVLYSDGGAKILFTNLSPDLQKKYGYDPAKAATFTAEQQAADLAQKSEEAARAEKDRARDEALNNAVICLSR